ncbi:MAG TPA: MFS transporter [Bryobacteraceae bacterium]|nr:MFS transporter [Bryobacteraceae bacterium]
MSSAKTIAPPVQSRNYSRLRWGITALLFFSTVINYMDRQNLSILARTIQNDLKISDLQYSYVVQAFLLAYTLSYVVAGRFTDWLGTRLSMAIFVIWWSVADMCTSLSRSVYSLGFFRFLLGVGEPGNYTAAPKAVSEWFAAKDRALIIGIYTAGATLGAAIAPPVIAHLANHFSWRVVFLCTGSLGLIWVIPWLLLYRKPPEVDEPAAPVVATENPWRSVLKRRETWVLTLGRLITDPVWYFYLFWFPKYLTDSRHLTLMELGRIAWMVYLAADIGCLVGGYLSGRFIRQGHSPVASRIRVMAIAAILLPLSPFVPHVPTALLAVLLASTAAFAHLSWQISLSAMVVDLFPKHLVGTVFGIVAAGSGLGGMISTNLVGHLVTSYSYTPVFLAMGFLHPLAFLLIRTLGKEEPR